MKEKNISSKTEPQAPKWRTVDFLVALAAHWTFQSLLYMDRSERWFKLALDAVLTLLFGVLLSLWWPWPLALAAGFVLAHTANFLFNAQFCALGANYGLVRTSFEEFTGYAGELGRRIEQEPSIQQATVCGSLAQDAWHDEADLDVRILRYPGVINGLRAAWFVLRERTRAHFSWFPLDIYLLDSEEALHAKLRSQEPLAHLPAIK
jgi:hypothetical protein